MHRWKFSVLAAAAVMAAGLHSGDAQALALGRISVQSALGEPLRAEIEVPQITPAEAETLRAATASPDVFRAQGMEYTPSVNGVQVQVQRRADGTAVLRLSSNRPINEPFVDLVLDANWNGGRVVRSYTMLFDPPALRRATPAVTAAPQVTAPAPVETSAPAVTAAPVAAPREPVVAAAPAVAPRTRTAPRPTQAPASGDSVTVNAGDTAGRLANAHRPSGISLDQMLVAMMRANPNAFINGNVNRIKAGAVLQMPDAAAAGATTQAEARQILATQSRDFGKFRRQMADAAPAVPTQSADRAAKGSVQTAVKDSKRADTPDKLIVGKASAKGKKTAEDQLASEKQKSETAERSNAISKNINDLNKIEAASSPANTAPAPVASAPASAPAVAVPVPVAAVEPPASEPATPASAPASAEATPAPTPEPVASAPAPAPTPVPAAPVPAPAEPSFIDGLMDEPTVPLAVGGLLALLLGYGAYRVVQRRKNGAGVDSSFLESRIQPDSFFGASGGQRVDTANSELTTGSSMAYSPSQLDAGGDVDPVAEADVYLAYGRDLQAEEILKEAIRHNPARVSVHVKLAEIYAKRQDRKALEGVAEDVFKLTQGEGPDWSRIVDLGRGLDPENSLYQPGGRPTAAAAAAATAEAVLEGPASALPSDLDLDLGLDLPTDPSPAPAAAGGFAAAAAAAAAAPSAELELPQLDSVLPDSAAAEPELTIAPSGAMPLTAATDTGPMDFDLGDLALDLTGGAKADPADAENTAASPIEPAQEITLSPEDPLATKLALAEEFNAIGDTDGARTLIEEVVAESTGALKERAQKLLSELG